VWVVLDTIASAGRFEPIPELEVDELGVVLVVKLTCCGLIPGGKWNPPIDGVEARFDSSLLEDDDNPI
jgi:hypothetical protein